MKVLGLFGDGYGGFGGMSRFNRDLIEALCADERVEGVIGLARVGDSADTPLPPGLDWRIARGKTLFTVTAMHAAWSAGPRIVICGLASLSPVAAAAARIARASLWTIGHGIDVWQRPSWIVARGVESSDLVTTVSRYTRRRLLQWARIPPERVRVLPNTWEEDRFVPGPRPADLSTRYGLDDARVLMTVGRLDAREAYKGQDRVIRVLPRLLRSDPKVRYLIVGDGSDRPRLEALAHDCGVSREVVFAGRIDDDERVDHYRLADVFVMPSTGEGFGIVFLEAAACGVPVVAGNRDGSVDALREGGIGILVDPCDEAALERGIREALVRGPGVPADLAALARERFRALVPFFLGRLVPDSERPRGADGRC